MATVKYTKTLRDEVLTNIMSGYTSRIKEIQTETDTYMNELSFESILPAIINETGGQELYKQCIHWLPKENSIFINSINDVSVGRRMYAKDHKPISIIINNNNGHYIIKAMIPFTNQLAALKTKLKDIQNKQDKTIDEVDNAFSAYSSVNAAIKANPSLALLLPKDMIDKINEKTVRAKPKDVVVPEFNAAEIASLAVINRMQLKVA